MAQIIGLSAQALSNALKESGAELSQVAEGLLNMLELQKFTNNTYAIGYYFFSSYQELIILGQIWLPKNN